MSDAVSKVQVIQEGTDLVFVRHFKAPPALVFSAWTEPAHLLQWWAPHHFTNRDCVIDAQAGGQWAIVMQGPDGKAYPCQGYYLEVDPPRKLVWTDLSHDMPDDWIDQLNKYRKSGDGLELKIVMTALFEADGAGTRVTITSHFANVVDRDAIVQMGAIEGWAQSLEKLDDLLAALQ